MNESDKIYWKSIRFEGLTDDENLLIAEARIGGFAEFFSCYPDYLAQGQKTLAAAKKYLNKT